MANTAEVEGAATERKEGKKKKGPNSIVPGGTDLYSSPKKKSGHYVIEPNRRLGWCAYVHTYMETLHKVIIVYGYTDQ